MAYKDKEKNRAYERERYKKNRLFFIEKSKSFRIRNPEKVKQYKTNWEATNPDKVKAYNKVRYAKRTEEQKEKTRVYNRTRRKIKRSEVLEETRRRQAGLGTATPKWLTNEDKKLAAKIYKEAKRLTELTGIQFHVDHIVPLRGEAVCGLHVPWNLQVLPYYENIAKGNRC